MKILAIENEYEGKSSDDFKPYLKDEAMVVWEFLRRVLLENYILEKIKILRF